MNMRDVYVGNRIADGRIRRGVSLEDLARDIGISPEALIAIESGATRIDAEHLAKIAQSLNFPLAYFFSGFDGGAPA